jgi:hypothetical protein
VSKTEVLILIFIGFYVPALTTRPICSETSLQLSENITLFSLSHIYRCHQQRDLERHRVFGVYHLDICTRCIVCDKTEHCGISACMSLGVYISPSTETLNFLWENIALICFIRLIEKLYSYSLYSKQTCHVLWNAFSISKNTAAVDILLLKFKVKWSVSLMDWSVVLCRARKPNWFALSRSFALMYLWTIFRMSFRIAYLLQTRG